MRRGKYPAVSAFLVASAAVVAAGCGGAQSGSQEGTGGSSGGGSGVSVVASTTQIGDFVRNVGGDAIEEHQILQPNSDPHDYEPRPEDVRNTATANLVFVNGQDLDPWMESVVSESGSEAAVVDLGENLASTVENTGHAEEGEEGHSEEDHSHEGEETGAHSEEDHSHEGEEAHSEEGHSEKEHAHEGEEGHSEEGHAHEGEETGAHSEEDHAHEGEEGHSEEAHSEEAHSEESGHAHGGEYDPHWWNDPANAESAVESVRDSLIEADPENEQVYTENAEAYLAQIQTLDEEIAACMAEISEDQRKLVSDHEAFGYLTDRYDIEFVGAVIPSQSTQAQASAGDTAELVRTIEEENVQAVFPEVSVSASLAQTIADETGASAEYTLYGDALGPEGSDGDTYLKMMAANANALTQGFTDGEQTCEISAGS